MSHEIFAHTELDPGAASLAERFAALFPGGALDPIEWAGSTRVMRGTWPRIGSGARELEIHAESRPADGAAPRGKKAKLLAAARWAFTIPVVDGPELAIAWALATAIADAGKGLVLDPWEGEWLTVAEAKRRASSEARIHGEVVAPIARGPESSWERVAREEHEQCVAAEADEARLAGMIERGDHDELATWIASGAGDDGFVSRAFDVLCDRRALDAARVTASALGLACLTVHLCSAVRAPGFRTRMLVELLGDAGVLAVIDAAQRTSILAAARQWKNRDVEAELRARGWTE